MDKLFLFNDEVLSYNPTQAVLPVDERATNFGDGVYEVIKIYNGKYYLLDEHIDRLYRSLQLIRIDFQWDRTTLVKKLHELLTINNFNGSGHVYFQVSRGSAVRNHLFPNTTTNFFAYLVEVERPFQTMKNGVHAITLKDIRWLHCDIKSLNLLPNILAKQEASEKGCYEAILLRDGYVTEGSSSNIFAVHGNKIHTRPNSELILPGIVKKRILDLCAKNNLTVLETPFLHEFLMQSDEVFLTSSTSEVTPIIKIDDVFLNGGQVGEVTRSVQKLYCDDANIDVFF